MSFQIFAMERMQSVWEHRVRFNLSESGVHPLELADLVDPREIAHLHLVYPPTNGSDTLRALIAADYPGATPDHVVVTNGTAEANCIALWNAVQPGTEIVVLMPNYMQIWGLASNLGARVRTVFLTDRGGRWAPDLDLLRSVVNRRTRLVAVCHPNNPTGAMLTEPEVDEICAIAGRAGAWVLSDEVYRGAELDGPPSPSFWGRYERVLVTCGLSKAYGLPGLRIGWVVGPTEKVASLWAYKDYTTIGPSAISERLAEIALEPEKRRRILERTRAVLQRQYPIVSRWVDGHGGLLNLIPPQAGAIAYVRYHFDLASAVLADRLRDEKSVLVVPGEHFSMSHYLRIGFGGEPDILEQGLELCSELFATVAPRATSDVVD